MNKKYVLTKEFKTTACGAKVYRIKAVKAFGNVSKGELGFVAAKGRCHDEKEEHHHHPDDCSACYEMYGYAFKEGYERGLEETRINLRGLKKDVERGQSPARALDKLEKWLEKEAGKK